MSLFPLAGRGLVPQAVAALPSCESHLLGNCCDVSDRWPLVLWGREPRRGSKLALALCRGWPWPSSVWLSLMATNTKTTNTRALYLLSGLWRVCPGKLKTIALVKCHFVSKKKNKKQNLSVWRGRFLSPSPPPHPFLGGVSSGQLSLLLSIQFSSCNALHPSFTFRTWGWGRWSRPMLFQPFGTVIIQKWVKLSLWGCTKPWTCVRIAKSCSRCVHVNTVGVQEGSLWNLRKKPALDSRVPISARI